MNSSAAFSAPPAARDLAAFNRLVEQHQTLLYTVAFRLLGEAEDATTATHAAVSAAFARPCPPGCLGQVWLLRCVLAACGGRGRPGHGLAALPVEQRQAVALVDLAGLDYAQAAAVLEVPPAVLRARLAAARRALTTARAAL